MMRIFAVLLVLEAAALAAPQSQCVTSPTGESACGFDCRVSPIGTARCARTRYGACATSPTGDTVCWDPAPELRRLLQRANLDVKGRCVVSPSATIACGWDCRIAPDGHARCAQTPVGACAVPPAGNVTCWDPSTEVIWQMLADEALERAECKVGATMGPSGAAGGAERSGTNVACGYHCRLTATSVVCAPMP